MKVKTKRISFIPSHHEPFDSVPRHTPNINDRYERFVNTIPGSGRATFKGRFDVIVERENGVEVPVPIGKYYQKTYNKNIYAKVTEPRLKEVRDNMPELVDINETDDPAEPWALDEASWWMKKPTP